MLIKKYSIPLMMLSLVGLSSTAYAQIDVTKSLNGITRQFSYTNALDASVVFSDVNQNSQIFHDSNRIGEVIVVTDSSTSTTFTVIRANVSTFVVAQADSTNTHMVLTTIQAPTGVSVEGELEKYLYPSLFGQTSYAKAGIDAAILSNSNPKVDTLTSAINKAESAPADPTGTAAEYQVFLSNLNKIKATTPSTDPLPVSNIPFGYYNPTPTNTLQDFKAAASGYIKNGMLQGNPASQISQMAYFDQNLDLGGVAGGHLFSNNVAGGDGWERHKSQLAVKTRLSTYNIGNQSVQVYTVAPSYTKELGKGWGLLFDAPLSYVNGSTYSGTTYGSQSSNSTYNASLGLGLRMPMARFKNINWDLVPLGRISAVNLNCANSKDLQCADSSMVYSGGIQSNLGLNLGAGYSLLAQNQFTYNSTSLFSHNLLLFGSTVANVTSNQSINVYRNGLQLIKYFDYSLFGRALSSNLSFADTRFDSGYGSLINNQQEYGINFNLRGESNRSSMIGKDFKLGITYTDAAGVSQAVSGNLGVTF